MQLANEEAQRFGHEHIATEHVLLGIIKEGNGGAVVVLRNLNIDPRKVRLEVEKLLRSHAEMAVAGQPPCTLRTKRVIEYAIDESRNLGHDHVGTEHVLLGFLRENEGVAARVL
jgi:ATP-dependent Clp protease ATP-binding subunit ClpC